MTEQKDFAYASLTPDLILDAIESRGIYPESGLLALNSYENRVYQFKADDQRRYVVKFYRPARWSEAQILEEHQLAFELAKSEVPIVAPMQFDGKSLFNYQSFWFCLFPSAGGREFEVDNLEQLEWVGRFMGRAHAAVQQSQFQHRPTIDIESYMLEPREYLRASGFIPSHIDLAFFTALDLLIDKAQQQLTPHQQIRLHGDCHPGNILWRDEPIFVDLDDARMGPAVQDLWMMLSGDRQEKLLQLDTLLMGYEEFCEFDVSQLSLIEPLRAMRMVHYMAWLAKRWQDPAFPHNFPWFNTPRYWEDQVLAIKEQLAVMDEPVLSLRPGY
ncbi:serine/threonine protein kinase [Motilimonas pumila]|uniref:Stress response kinase A n=1 Tax=Motilimonas pumila TaxID=2303987 RepID=A0A418YH76_9GAMM|nr:serine/threonine protein kinase [Motilimonas pumila]RJG49448.1 serine/threonine protein kinase [Motilimonas pumila]